MELKFIVLRNSTNLCDNSIKWQGAITAKYLNENPEVTNRRKQVGNLVENGKF